MAVHAHVRIVYLKFPLSSGQFKRFELGVNNIHVVCRWIHIVAAWCPPHLPVLTIMVKVNCQRRKLLGCRNPTSWDLGGYFGWKSTQENILPVSSIASSILIVGGCWLKTLPEPQRTHSIENVSRVTFLLVTNLETHCWQYQLVLSPARVTTVYPSIGPHEGSDKHDLIS